MAKPYPKKKSKDITWQRPSMSNLQEKILDSPERIIAVLATTKSGKTFAAVEKCIEAGIQGKSCVWVSSTFSRARTAFELAERGLQEAITGGFVEFNKSNYAIKFCSGGSIHFYSGEATDTLAGEEASGVLVLDEAARQPEATFILSRTLITPYPEAQMLLLSNADRSNSNWFIRLYNKIKNGDITNAVALTETCYQAPAKFIAAEEIEQAKNLLPDTLFRALYLAIPLQDDSSVFGSLEKVINGELEGPKIGNTYVIGYDLAKLVDRACAITYCYESKKIVDFSVMRYVPYTNQVDILMDLSKKYNGAQIIYDATGVGVAVGDVFNAKGAYVEPYVFTNKTKSELVYNLIKKIETAAFSMPRIPLLIDELAGYTQKETPSGQMTFAANKEGTDDCVSALMLAMWKARGYQFTSNTLHYSTSPCAYIGELSLGV